MKGSSGLPRKRAQTFFSCHVLFFEHIFLHGPNVGLPTFFSTADVVLFSFFFFFFFFPFFLFFAGSEKRTKGGAAKSSEGKIEGIKSHRRVFWCLTDCFTGAGKRSGGSKKSKTLSEDEGGVADLSVKLFELPQIMPPPPCLFVQAVLTPNESGSQYPFEGWSLNQLDGLGSDFGECFVCFLLLFVFVFPYDYTI